MFLSPMDVFSFSFSPSLTLYNKINLKNNFLKGTSKELVGDAPPFTSTERAKKPTTNTRQCRAALEGPYPNVCKPLSSSQPSMWVCFMRQNLQETIPTEKGAGRNFPSGSPKGDLPTVLKLQLYILSFPSLSYPIKP